MRNAHPGTCYRCGHSVQKGEGHFEKVGRSHRKKWGNRCVGKWLIQHAECAIKYRGTDTHFEFRPEGETYVSAEQIFN